MDKLEVLPYCVNNEYPRITFDNENSYEFCLYNPNSENCRGIKFDYNINWEPNSGPIPSDLHFQYINSQNITQEFRIPTTNESIFKPVLSKPENLCYHEWVEYHGFTESYKYCKKCDKTNT